MWWFVSFVFFLVCFCFFVCLVLFIFFLTWIFYLVFPFIWRLFEKAKFSVLWLAGVFLTFPDLGMVLYGVLQWEVVHRIIRDVDRFLEAVRDIERMEDLWPFCRCGLEPFFLCGTVRGSYSSPCWYVDSQLFFCGFLLGCLFYI